MKMAKRRRDDDGDDGDRVKIHVRSDDLFVAVEVAR